MHDSAAVRFSVALMLVVPLAGFAVTLSGCGQTPYEEGASNDDSSPGGFTRLHGSVTTFQAPGPILGT